MTATSKRYREQRGRRRKAWRPNDDARLDRIQAQIDERYQGGLTRCDPDNEGTAEMGTSKFRRDREGAPPAPGMIPGGIRDRALRAVLTRGLVPEDPEKTKASQEFWRAFREKRAMTGKPKAANEKNDKLEEVSAADPAGARLPPWGTAGSYEGSHRER